MSPVDPGYLGEPVVVDTATGEYNAPAVGSSGEWEES
jgi:hypothetical protein